MSYHDDCNIDANVMEYGRCICETCGPGKYKAEMSCGENGHCIMAEDKTVYDKIHYYTVFKCLKCNYGEYQNEIGAESCKKCAAGTYQDNYWHEPPVQIIKTVSTSNGEWIPERQELYCKGTSGSFNLEFNGEKVKYAIQWNATPGEIIEALESISHIETMHTTSNSKTSVCSKEGTKTEYIFHTESVNLPNLPSIVVPNILNRVNMNEITRFNIIPKNKNLKSAGDFKLLVGAHLITITSDGLNPWDLKSKFETILGAANIKIKTTVNTLTCTESTTCTQTEVDNSLAYDVWVFDVTFKKELGNAPISIRLAPDMLVPTLAGDSTGVGANARIVISELSIGGTPSITTKELVVGSAPLSGTFGLTLNAPVGLDLGALNWGGTIPSVRFDESASELEKLIMKNFGKGIYTNKDGSYTGSLETTVAVTRSGPTRGGEYEWTITFLKITDEIKPMTMNIHKLRGDDKNWGNKCKKTTSDTCVPCPLNEECQRMSTRIVKGGSAPIISCKTCPNGYVYKQPVASTCVSCVPGTMYNQTDQPCIHCSKGLYQKYPELSFDADICPNCEPHLHKENEPNDCICNDMKCKDDTNPIWKNRKTCKENKHVLHPFIECETCRIGRAPPKTSFEKCQINKKGVKECSMVGMTGTLPCEKCAIGRYQEFTLANVWDCKTCPKGYAFATEKTSCVKCTQGLYQDKNDAESVECKSCSFGKDAPNVNTSCANCAVGRFQNLSISNTYGCMDLTDLNSNCREGDGKSLVDGNDVEIGKLTIRLYEGTCCSGTALSTEVMFLDRCLLSNTGSVYVSLQTTTTSVLFLIFITDSTFFSFFLFFFFFLSLQIY